MGDELSIRVTDADDVRPVDLGVLSRGGLGCNFVDCEVTGPFDHEVGAHEYQAGVALLRPFLYSLIKRFGVVEVVGQVVASDAAFDRVDLAFVVNGGQDLASSGTRNPSCKIWLLMVDVASPMPFGSRCGSGSRTDLRLTGGFDLFVSHVSPSKWRGRSRVGH